MSFMDVDGWDTKSYEDVRAMNRVKARWLPNDSQMEISQAISLEGALSCNNCHGEQGGLDWAQLGYTPDEIASLQEDPRD